LSVSRSARKKFAALRFSEDREPVEEVADYIKGSAREVEV